MCAMCAVSMADIWCCPVRNQEVRVQMAPFTITPIDSLSKFMLPVSEALGSTGLEILVPKKENTSTRGQHKHSTGTDYHLATLGS